jgi:hypothetical protein
MQLPGKRRFALAAERKRRAALLPPNAACGRCGTTDPAKLDANLAPILCADHAAEASGKRRFERHHLGGRGWDIVLDLTPNWHRVVTALQRMRESADSGRMSELLYGLSELNAAIGDHLEEMEKEKSDESKAKNRSKTPRPKPRRSAGR